MTDDINLDLPGVGETNTQEATTAETSQTATTAETGQATETAATSVVADTAEALVPVETLAKDLAVPAWKLAGLMRHQRWASGKAVTETVFKAALAAFEGRPLGGGR